MYQYEQFWENPQATPIMWLGLLFCIMCLATLYSLRAGRRPIDSEAYPEESVLLYRRRAVQCLKLADYTQNAPYTIETLLLYLCSEYFRSNETQFGVWLVFGMVVRLAFRMGYHRHPRHYPGRISAFDAEMRRRVWAVLLPLETLGSGQVGQPFLIKLSQVDTEPPANLHDQDFDKNTSVMPPGRPPNELTAVSYTIIKTKLAAVYGQISDLTSSIRPASYDDVMRWDRQLRDTYASTPPPLQMRPVRSSILDPPHLIMQRFNLDLLFLKTVCILHRKYLILAWSESQYSYSRTACIEAAWKILRHQAVIHAETKPDGLLHENKWLVSAISSHDFLLAAMILCLDIDHRRRSRHQTEQTTSPLKEEELLQALEESHAIWRESSGQSTEALSAYQTLSIMLNKLDRKDPASVQVDNNDITIMQGALSEFILHFIV